MNIGSKLFARYFGISLTFVGVLVLILMYPQPALSTRLKDVAKIKGVRENILIGYGIVVGLKGTGDSSADVTGQSLKRLFEKLGLEIGPDTNIKSKNAAAAIVTANLPPFARIGNKIDVTVSSIGDAASLEGGMLLVTPLRAGDQNVYAVAQGNVTLGTMNGDGSGYPTTGRVVNGATIEKDLDMNFAAKKNFRLSLNQPDFTTAARVVALINGELGGKYATARDSGTIDVVVPFTFQEKSVQLLAILENIQVNVDTRAKVVVDEKTGTVVMGSDITISPVAIAHGDLSIEVVVEKKKKVAKKEKDDKKKDKDKEKEEKKKEYIVQIKNGTSVSNLVKALNALGTKPKDLTAIFQTLKRVGALQADLEVI